MNDVAFGRPYQRAARVQTSVTGRNSAIVHAVCYECILTGSDTRDSACIRALGDTAHMRPCVHFTEATVMSVCQRGAEVLGNECTVTEVRAVRCSCTGVLDMRFALTASLVLLCASTTRGQSRVSPRIADSSMTTLMARVRREAGAPWQADIRRQIGTARSKMTLDAIADSLTLVSIDVDGTEQPRAAFAGAVRAVNALAWAGSNGPQRGRPYLGMLERMIAVHQRARSTYIRMLALDHMLISPTQHARAVEYVRQVAESSDSTAGFAVESLIRGSYGGGLIANQPSEAARLESVEALRALAAGGRVTDRQAAKALGSWIYVYPTQRPRRERR
jgi:hypothetical protein